MINPKYISISAGLGFVVSFLIGLLSGIGFGHVALRALVCALFFGMMSVGILFLNQKFLSDGQTDDLDGSVEKMSQIGGVIEITVDDDRLPEEEQGPRFNVASTRPALRQVGAATKDTVDAERQVPSPVSEPTPVPDGGHAGVPSQVETPAGFTPLGLAQVASAVAEQKQTKVAPQPVAPSHAAVPSASADLGELPDISTFGGGDTAGVAAGEDIVEDSEFAEADVPQKARSSVFPDGVPASEQSASLMAQAIRTVLVRE